MRKFYKNLKLKTIFYVTLFILAVCCWKCIKLLLIEKIQHTTASSYEGINSIQAKSSDLFFQRKDNLERFCYDFWVLIRKSDPKYSLFANIVKNDPIFVRIPPLIDTDASYIENPTIISWCPIYKAASTAWLAQFAQILGVLTPKDSERMIKTGQIVFRDLIEKLYSYNGPSFLKTSKTNVKKLLIVRNPFDRIVSAYRNKIETKFGQDFYYKKYSIPILSKFRLEHLRSNQNETGTINRKFRSTILNYIHTKRKLEMELETEKTLPTFAEFVKFLIASDPSKMDEHWRPMYFDCNPCKQKFDYILKVESMDEDRQVFLEQFPSITKNRTLMNELDFIWRKWSNKSKPMKNCTSLESKMEYFGNLSKIELNLLYTKYQLDFLMFNYSAEPYFKRAY